MKRLKYIPLIIVSLLILPILSYSQDVGVIDIVKMKNGHEFRGEVVDIKENGDLVFRLKSGNTIDMPASEVKSVKQEYFDGSKWQSRGKKAYNFRESGWFASVSGGIIAGNGGDRYYDQSGFAGEVSGGYQFNRWIGVGLHTGYKSMVKETQEDFVPVGVQVRGFLLAKNIAPFYTFNAGYGISAGSSEGFTVKKGGIYLEPSLGLRLSGGSGVNTFLSFGFQYQKAEYEAPMTWWNIWPPIDVENAPRENQKLGYKRWIIKAGIMF